jgi:hypothetical protein
VPTGDCLPTITPNDSSCAVAVDDPSAEGEVIHGYSRGQAIADGLFIDVAEEISREAGFTIPVAMTAAAWADCVEWTDADTARTGAIQDVQGRLWDVLWMTRFAIRRARGATDRVRVRLYRGAPRRRLHRGAAGRTGRRVRPRRRRRARHHDHATR